MKFFIKDDIDSVTAAFIFTVLPQGVLVMPPLSFFLQVVLRLQTFMQVVHHMTPRHWEEMGNL